MEFDAGNGCSPDLSSADHLGARDAAAFQQGGHYLALCFYNNTTNNGDTIASAYTSLFTHQPRIKSDALA